MRIGVLPSSLLAAALCGCTQPAEPPPAPASELPASVEPADADADAAADRLRHLLSLFDPEACVEEGEASLRRHPGSSRLRAWFIACLAGAERSIEAEDAAAQMLAERPDDPWAEFARVAAWLAQRAEPRPEALHATEALVRALAEHPDALRMRARALLALDRNDAVLELARAHGEDGLMQVPRIRALFSRTTNAPETLPEALAAAGRARGVAAVDAAYLAAYHLSDLDRFAEALPWIDAAVAASPGSVTLRRLRWTILQKLPERDADARRAAVLADIDALLELRGSSPSALLAAAEAYRELDLGERADALEARLLAEFADSRASEALLVRRLFASLGSGPAVSPEARAERRAQIEAFLARPRLYDRVTRETVLRLRLDALCEDPSSTPEAVLAAVEQLHALPYHEAPTSYVDGVLALAERGAHLERAEAVAREGLGALESRLRTLAASGAPDDVVEPLGRDWRCLGHDALGAVLLARGRLDEADSSLNLAHEACPNYIPNLMHLAASARRRGDLDAAETYLVAGLDRFLGAGPNPCMTALEEIYRERRGSMAGFSRHLDRLEARAREGRRAAVLARAVAEPQPLPPFELERLDGATIASDALRGKIVVIKFWYTTCGPCIAELPEFAALARAYARDPEVEILTIHNDGEADEIAAWMREHGHDFPVLLDRGYCEQAGVRAFPTIWVLDRAGRVVFSERGAKPNLREEYGWRIESLRRRG